MILLSHWNRVLRASSLILCSCRRSCFAIIPLLSLVDLCCQYKQGIQSSLSLLISVCGTVELIVSGKLCQCEGKKVLCGVVAEFLPKQQLFFVLFMHFEMLTFNNLLYFNLYCFFFVYSIFLCIKVKGKALV